MKIRIKPKRSWWERFVRSLSTARIRSLRKTVESYDIDLARTRKDASAVGVSLANSLDRIRDLESELKYIRQQLEEFTRKASELEAILAIRDKQIETMAEVIQRNHERVVAETAEATHRAVRAEIDLGDDR